MGKVTEFRRVHWVLLCLIVLVGAGVRLLPWNEVFQDGHPLFFGADAYYHLRRLQLFLESGVLSPALDYYLGFPKGTVTPFPPLFYLFSGLPVLPFFGGPEKTWEFVAATLPVLFGAGSLLAVYALGRHLFSHSTGLVAAAVLALLPAHINRTLVGTFDNNALEPLLALIFLLLAAKSLPEDLQEEQTPFLWRPVCFAAVSGWVFLFTWRGASLFLFLLLAYGMLEFFLALGTSRRATSICRPIALVSLLIAAGTLPFVVTGTWGAQPKFSFSVVSYFHVVILAGGGAGLLLLTRALPFLQRRAGWRVLVAVGIVTVFSTLSFVMVTNQGRSSSLSLAQYLWGGGTLWGIEELKGLIGPDGRFLWGECRALFAWTFILVPVAWFVLLVEEFRSGLSRPRRNFFLVWGVTLLVLVVGRLRFAAMAGIPVALLIAYFAVTLSRGFRKWRPRFGVRFALIVLVLSVSLWPAVSHVTSLPTVSYRYPVTDDLFAALQWLREETPPSSNHLDPWDRPDYGVLAQWDFGHWINYLGQRPSVATNLSKETYGMEASASFFLSQSADEVQQVLSDNRVRYVVVSNVLRYLPGFADVLNLPREDYYSEAILPSGQVMDVPGPEWGRLVSTRLLLNDGVSLPFVSTKAEAPNFLRLVYESRGRLDMRIPGFVKVVPRIKIFERVPGVRVRGHAAPFARVEAELLLRSNQGRLFSWKANVVADRDGIYTLTSPYATGSNHGSVASVGLLAIKVAGHEMARLELAESAVLAGAMVQDGEMNLAE